MKKYLPIIIGIVALLVVLYVGNKQIKDTDLKKEEKNVKASLTSFSGKVVRVFEGENALEYSFDLPETATTSIEKDGALIKVVENGSPIVNMYMSYEGARGYTPADYVTNIIVPNVSAITDKGTTTLGLHEWSVVESEWSEWYIGKAGNGSWLTVAEYKKGDKEKALAILESLSTK